MAGKYSKKKRISALEVGLAAVAGLLVLVLLAMVGLIAARKEEAPETTEAVTTQTTVQTAEETTAQTRETTCGTTMETTPAATEETTEAAQPETTVPETKAAEKPQTPAPGGNTGGSTGGGTPDSSGGGSAEPGHVHDFAGNSKTDYNCETGGSRTYYCRTCDYSYTEELAARGQHTLMDMPSSMCDGPGCTTYGKMFRVCTKCNYIITVDDPNQPPLGHNYRESLVPPTTESQGYTQYTCDRCSDSYQDNFVPALPAETAPPQTQPPETQAPAPEGES